MDAGSAWGPPETWTGGAYEGIGVGIDLRVAPGPALRPPFGFPLEAAGLGFLGLAGGKRGTQTS
jgi:hypothetical protein